MTNASILLQGLKEYARSLKNHRRHIESDFQHLQYWYGILSDNYHGEGADLLQGHWEKTVGNFDKYLDSTLHLTVLLDERIETLTFFEKANRLEGLFTTAVNAMSMNSKAGWNSDLSVMIVTSKVILDHYVSNLGGGHKAQYRRSRQVYLKNLINDPNQPTWIRKMIKNRLRKKHKYIKGIPGYDVGHRIPDIDVPINYRLELVSLNRSRDRRAKKCGIKHYR